MRRGLEKSGQLRLGGVDATRLLACGLKLSIVAGGGIT